MKFPSQSCENQKKEIKKTTIFIPILLDFSKTALRNKDGGVLVNSNIHFEKLTSVGFGSIKNSIFDTLTFF